MNQIVHSMWIEPWPDLTAQTPDSGKARALFSIYAGRRGVLTAAAQDFCSSLCCAEQPACAELFAYAAQCELIHLKKLGQLIWAYGGIPKLVSFSGGRAQPWTAGTLSYPLDSTQMLTQAAALAGDIAAHAQHLAPQMDDVPQQILLRIKENEQTLAEGFLKEVGDKHQLEVRSLQKIGDRR